MVWLDLLWLTLVKLSLEAVLCVEVGDKHYLLTALAQECFTEEHTPIFITSIMALLICLVIQPVSVFCLIRRDLNQKTHRQPHVRAILSGH